jgi:hypothetical protein
MQPILPAPLHVLSCTLMQGLDDDDHDNGLQDNQPGFALQCLMRPRKALCGLLNRMGQKGG